MINSNVPISKLADSIQKTLQKKVDTIFKNEPQLLRAFDTIGNILVKEMKMSIQRQRIIDTGKLINSTTYEFYKEQGKIGVKAGTFGVHYAKYHEFGAKFDTSNLRAMFWAKRAAGEQNRRFEDKNVVDLDSQKLKKRPYIAPSISKKRNRVLQIIKSIYKFK